MTEVKVIIVLHSGDGPFAPASQDLLVSGQERRYVANIGIFDIAGIAKAISIGLLAARFVSFSRDDIAAMHGDVLPHNRDEEESGFTAYMLRFPGIVCRFSNGRLRLLDGRKRVRRAFRDGASSVRVAVFALDDARRLDLIDESQTSLKILEATQDAPLEAEGQAVLREAMIAREVHPSDGGRPRLTDMQIRLRAFMIYYLNALIDIEDWVRKVYPFYALFKSVGTPRTNKEVWARAFFTEFMASNAPEFSLSYDVVKNEAANALRDVTEFTTNVSTRTEYKKMAEIDLKGRTRDDIIDDRDGTLIQSIIVMKAFYRLESFVSVQRYLYHREMDNKPIDYLEVQDVYYQRETPSVRRTPSKRFLDTQMSLEDQIYATMCTGINMNLVYGNYQYLDSLFEAHVLRFNMLYFKHSNIAMGLMETAAYRRDMMMIGVQDKFSAYWEELFELWHESGITDLDIHNNVRMLSLRENFKAPAILEWRR